LPKDYVYNAGAAYAAVAQKNPHEKAFCFADGTNVSHGDFNTLSNRVAAFLEQRGVARGDVVGIVHTKAIHCYAFMLGALKIGAIYVNLDDQNPAARLEHIMRTARPTLVVGRDMPDAFRRAAGASGSALLDLCEPEVMSAIQSAAGGEPSTRESVIGTDPAYIMYTSGSTGIPKGALITHANILNFARWVGERFGIGTGDVLTNVNPMYFDNSVFDFYGGLLNGAAIAPVTREVASNASSLLEQLEAARCTVWFSVPSLLIYLTTVKALDGSRLPNLRTFVFGGEGYPKPELRKLYAAFGNRCRLINVYGPTECTCICSAWDVRADDLKDSQGLVTLGKIAENFGMLVLDGERPVDAGAVGELCLLGPQVGLGYVNDPERTALAFVQNPVNARWGERMYRTGDLVRLGEDGRMLDFVGRKDNQVKHMGYRIELEEIEAALNQIEGIIQSAVLQRSGRRDMKALVAYVASQRDFSASTLRELLGAFLPPYMIPQRFVIRATLPKNANGKVDRIALASEEVVF
jgi:D-alanine--poly(phosphoribitol) ligase subunit 1